MEYTVGFIGAGNMGSALLQAAVTITKSIAVSNRTPKKARKLAEKFGVTHTDNVDIAQHAKYIFLGVKPQMLKELFDEIAPILRERTDEFVIVTMAAGVSIDNITEFIGTEVPTVRIMPNTPVSVGKGTVLYCANSLVEELDELLDILDDAGTLDNIPENLMDAASCLTGCSPAWIYMFIESLADGGVRCGLPRAKAVSYACDALIGAAELVKQSGKHPGLLKDEVCSPGGTTIEGVAALENGGFRSSVIEAVGAAYEKSLKMMK